MRKIEEQMLRAIAEHRNWRKSNTRVNIVNEWAEVFLFGNKIAQINLDSGDIYATHHGYPTVTTKSRLRALGLLLHQKNKTLYVEAPNGVLVPWTTICRCRSYSILRFTDDGYFCESAYDTWPEMRTEQQIMEQARLAVIEKMKNGIKARIKRQTRQMDRNTTWWVSPNFF